MAGDELHRMEVNITISQSSVRKAWKASWHETIAKSSKI